MLLYVYSSDDFEFISHSVVNGPGRRNVLHLQGCSIRCPGCFSRHTWDSNQGLAMRTEYLANLLLHNSPDGITISGGEPFDQQKALVDLCANLRDIDSEVSIIAFSGYPWKKIKDSPAIPLLDAVIAGSYIANRKTQEGLRGSDNQEVVLTSDRHSLEEFAGENSIEFLIDSDSVTITGFPDENVVTSVQRLLED